MKEKLIQALLFCLGVTLPLAWVPLPGLGQSHGMRLQLFDGFACFAGIVAFSLLRTTSPKLWLLLYPVSLLVSLLASPHPEVGLGVLFRGFYLASLGCVVDALVRSSPKMGRRALRSGWLAGFSLVVLGTLAGLVGFGIGFDNSLSNPFLFHHGSLAAGAYPRVCSTFLNANMMCNYLVVTLGWLYSWRIQALVLACASFTLSPGIGPLLFALLGRHPKAVVKAVGVMAACVFFIATWTYPMEALSKKEFRPSPRVLCWRQAWDNWVERPWLGQGPGQARVYVTWTDSAGQMSALTDPHNLMLSMLSQGGLLALLVFAGLTVRGLHSGDRGFATFLLAAIWLDGLTGSFEGARHIWVGLGVLEAGGAHTEGRLDT